MPLGARWLPGRRELAKLVLLAAAVPLASGCGLLGGLSGSRLVSPASMTVVVKLANPLGPLVVVLPK